MKYCQQCGAQLEEEMKFCVYCGASAEDSANAQQEQNLCDKKHVLREKNQQTL